jgi:hypothetical protein
MGGPEISRRTARSLPLMVWGVFWTKVAWVVSTMFLCKQNKVPALWCGHCHHEYSFNKGYSQAGGSILLVILVSVNEIISGSWCSMRALRSSLLLYMPFTFMVIALRLDNRPSGLFMGWIRLLIQFIWCMVSWVVLSGLVVVPSLWATFLGVSSWVG